MRTPKFGNVADFILRPHSKPYGGRFAPTPGAVMPRVYGFPLNRMKVGESFFMHRSECPHRLFAIARQRVRRCNATGAVWFICEWINDRQTLEIARIG